MILNWLVVGSSLRGLGVIAVLLDVDNAMSLNDKMQSYCFQGFGTSVPTQVGTIVTQQTSYLAPQ